MARYAPWWTAPEATPDGLADAARKAGVLIEAGDYAMGTLDLGDDGPLIDIQVSGSVIDAAGITWLVYPCSSRHRGWEAQPVHHESGAVRPVAHTVPRQLGHADEGADRILAALLDPAHEAGNRAVMW